MSAAASRWERAATRAVHAPTPPSISDEPPSPSLPKKHVPARVKLLIADLGLRYRPTAHTDLEAHANALALLAIDVADLPVDRLDRAIATWVRRERWMPRAADLIALCQEQQHVELFGGAVDARSERERAFAFCTERNAAIPGADHPRHGEQLEWYVDGGGTPRLRYVAAEVGEIAPVDPADVPSRNAVLARLHAPFRYDAHGRRRDLTFEEEDARLAAGGPEYR